MKKLSFGAVTFVALSLLAFYVYAQTPASVHVTWNPNPAAELDVDYQVSLDGGPAITVLASACSATQCPAAPLLVTVPTFGTHNLTVGARNLKLSTDPTSLQMGPLATISFGLGSLPVVVSGAKVTN